MSSPDERLAAFREAIHEALSSSYQANISDTAKLTLLQDLIYWSYGRVLRDQNANIQYKAKQLLEECAEFYE